MEVSEVAQDALPHKAQPRQIYVASQRFFAACAEDTWLEFLELQLEGKKRLTAAEFLRGTQLAAGERLG
jgi:methionyl-tRNA formyltransferase